MNHRTTTCRHLHGKNLKPRFFVKLLTILIFRDLSSRCENSLQEWFAFILLLRHFWGSKFNARSSFLPLTFTYGFSQLLRPWADREMYSGKKSCDATKIEFHRPNNTRSYSSVYSFRPAVDAALYQNPLATRLEWDNASPKDTTKRKLLHASLQLKDSDLFQGTP